MFHLVGRTLRHWPPTLLVTLVAYFGYRLLVEPEWFLWICTAAAAVGFLLNLIVIAANGGYMPVPADRDDVKPEQDDLYKPIDESTRLRLLADWIDVGRWLVSPGDVLLAAAAVASVIGRIAA